MAGSPKTGDLEVGRRIVARREELGLSRRALAEATDLSYPYVAQIETGYRLPSSRHQATLARALGLTLDELFGFDEPGEAEPPRRQDVRRRPERSVTTGRWSRIATACGSEGRRPLRPSTSPPRPSRPYQPPCAWRPSRAFSCASSPGSRKRRRGGGVGGREGPRARSDFRHFTPLPHNN